MENLLFRWSLVRGKKMENEKAFQIEVVSLRLVKDTPIYSERPITMPEHAVELIGKELCDMDREVVCIINLQADGVPINCNFASMGALDQAFIYPRELFKSSIRKVKKWKFLKLQSTL